MSDTNVVPGIDRFLADHRGDGKRYGLITNQTGITSKGEPTWKAMQNSGLNLVTIFGPEHGFRGESQDAVEIGDQEFHRMRVYSLYGDRLRPEPHQLEGLDALVFDIQDVGCRYYTYLYTLAYAMQVCAEVGLPFIVLDRPNPLNGVTVEGGPISREHDCFVGGYGLPPRYGMTIGEYARYVAGEYYPKADLTVIELSGFRRSEYGTGLPWVIPSPNLPSLECAVVYPGTCLFEGTNISEGRGTTRPFEIIGAPWIDNEQLRLALGARALPGATFASMFFTPTFSKHRGATCQGVMICVTDREVFKPLLTGITMMQVIRDLSGDSFEWRQDWEREGHYFLDRLAGGPRMREMFDAGADPASIYREMVKGQEDFLAARAKYLIYP